MEPSAHGHELSTGDHLGHDTTPDCCDTDMTATSPLAYECGECGTVLELDARGLVSDIREPQNAA